MFDVTDVAANKGKILLQREKDRLEWIDRDTSRLSHHATQVPIHRKAKDLHLDFFKTPTRFFSGFGEKALFHCLSDGGALGDRYPFVTASFFAKLSVGKIPFQTDNVRGRSKDL